MKRESIAETELIKEWCFEENDTRGLNPKQLTLGSSKRDYYNQDILIYDILNIISNRLKIDEKNTS